MCVEIVAGIDGRVLLQSNAAAAVAAPMHIAWKCRFKYDFSRSQRTELCMYVCACTEKRTCTHEARRNRADIMSVIFGRR